MQRYLQRIISSLWDAVKLVLQKFNNKINLSWM